MAKKFSYALSNGKTLELEGNEQPSDDEVESIAKEQGVKLQLAEPELNVEKPAKRNEAESRRFTEDYSSRFGGMKPSYGPKTEKLLSESLTDAPSRFAKQVSQYIDPEQGTTGLRSYGSAFIESLGNMVSGLTSPRSIAQEVLTGGSLVKGKLPKIAESIAAPVDELTQAKNILKEYGLTHKMPRMPIGSEIEYAQAIDPNFMKVKSTEIPYKMPDEIPNEAGQLTTISKGDPNLNQGIGDPELAGSSPYTNPSVTESSDELIAKLKEIMASSPKSRQQLLNEEALAKRRESYQSSQNPEVMQADQPLGNKSVRDNWGASEAEPNGVYDKGLLPSQMPEEVQLPTHIKNQGISQDRGYATQGNQPPVQLIPKQIIQTNQQASAMAKMMRPEEKEGIIRQALDFNRTLLTSYDMSGPGRQGLGLVTHPEFFTSLDDMFKSWGSKRGFETVLKSIEDDASGYFKRSVDELGKEVPSYAERVGLSVDSVPEEIYRGQGAKLAEKILPGVSASNRAYTGYLAKLRADVFKKLVNSAEKSGRDPLNDLVLGKNIANFVNTATGRGNLGKLEPIAKQLADVFFAPKLMASRIQTYNNVLNPIKFMSLDPMIRIEAIRSLLGVVGTGSTIAGLGKLAGGEVSLNPMNSDFGKIKVGKTRIDPYGGFQQYAVGAAKLLTGKSYSSISRKRTDLTAGRFGQQNRSDVLTNFFTNKLAPVPSFVWSWMQGKEFDGMPFDTKKAILSRTVPIVMQDLNEIYQEDPNLLPLGIPAALGMGVQTYGR